MKFRLFHRWYAIDYIRPESPLVIFPCHSFFLVRSPVSLPAIRVLPSKYWTAPLLTVTIGQRLKCSFLQVTIGMLLTGVS